MQQFLRMMAIFIQYPWLAALIGVLMLALGRSRGRGAPVAAGITWLLYPILLVVTVVGVVGLLLSGRAQR